MNLSDLMSDKNYASISILIVTYNQHDVIGRNIESILAQRDYGLKEIVICDDNSTDNNWEIIQSYVEKYPEYIRAYRNNKNLGIYGNAMRAVSLRGDADLYMDNLAGDDALCDGFLKSTQEFIIQNNIDLTLPCCIYADYKVIRPDGSERIHKHDYAKKMVDAFRAKLRGRIGTRSLFVSRSVIDNYGKIIIDQGVHLAESMFDCQPMLNSRYNYYNNYCGSVYYSRIGISTKMKSADYYREAIHNYQMIPRLYSLCKQDLAFCKMYELYYQYLIKPSFLLFCSIMNQMTRAIDISVGFSMTSLLIMARDMVERTLNKS